jgi:tetratricopeptide (TPR) repeat protein
VLAWLRKFPDWLLILDNVDSPAAQAAVKELAAPFTHGKILITSRLAAWPVGFAALDLDVLSPADSVKLLTDHTDGFRIPEPDEAAAAAEIARLVDGLALALEQAAAHIRKIRCSFVTYLKKWRDAETRLLADYHLRGIGDYHAPVAGQEPQEKLPRSLCVTFDASFRQLAPSARHLLQLLAWLAPDPMPVAHLETLAALPAAAETLADLAELHLVRYSADNRAFAVHRLIQEIVRREQTEAQPPPLREALEWVDGLYPNNSNDVRTWDIAAPLTPHAVAVATFAADRDIPEPTARLLNEAAILLNARADYRAAEPLYRRSLAIGEAGFGPDHPTVATRLNNLAQLLQGTNRLAEAEPLMRRVIAIFETNLGEGHPNVATSLNNLAQLLKATNRLAEAEPLMRRALAINEASYGPGHPKVAISLDNLAGMLQSTNRFAEAEPLMRRALNILEASFSESHPYVAVSLAILAQLLQATNRLAEAELLMRRAGEIFLNFTRATGHTHPDLQVAMGNYRRLLRALGRSWEEIESELSVLGERYGVDVSGMGWRRANEPPAKLRPVLEEIMRDESKTGEIAERLKVEDPELLGELIAFIESQE